MHPDEDLIRGLEAAVAASPSNLALRVHLADTLMDADRPLDALRHCVAILEVQPDHPQALGIAAAASHALGDEQRAEAYRRLRAALDPTPIVSSGPDAAGEATGPLAPYEIEGDEFEVERPHLRLADVGGMDQVKQRLRQSFLAPMENPTLREAFGKSLRGGLLLYGPPGCGKTFIARALAGELGARFLAVGLSDVLDMWLGNSERKLSLIFRSARRRSPCVLFLDEIDALGQKRAHLRHSAGRGVVVQLLTELDSVKKNNEGLFVLGATNHPWDVDPALRRPGRFDRVVLVLPPDEKAREAIFSYHLRERPREGIDLEFLARKTRGYSGADIAHVCETAAEAALNDSVETGVVRPIRMTDLKRALNEVRPSTEAWFQTARDFATYANEGGMYDDLLSFMQRGAR